jgi:hypothetical protein
MNTDTIIKDNFKWVAKAPQLKGNGKLYYGVKVTKNSIMGTDGKIVLFAKNSNGLEAGWYNINGKMISEDVPDIFPTYSIIEMNECFYDCRLNELQYKGSEYPNCYVASFELYQGSFHCVKEYFDKVISGFDKDKTRVFISTYGKKEDSLLVKLRQMTKSNYRTAFILFMKKD